MNNQEAANAFTEWMRTKRDAPQGTLEKYGRLARAWASFLPTNLADRTPEDVEAFTARHRRGGAAAAPATVANELAVLGSFYRWGQARLGWGSNPAVLAGRPKVHNRQPRPVDDDTWLHVWTQPMRDRARVALGLGYFLGLRRAEMIGLMAGQVWNGALVNFTRKNGGEDRIDYADLFAHWSAFMPWLEVERLEGPLATLARGGGERPLLWGTRVRPERVNKAMAQWLVQCGLASDAFTPHQLRHSFATNLLRSGVPLDVACDLCNHASPAVTMRYIRTSGGRLAALRAPGVMEVAK
jgi:site-specific recombinase XerD